MILEFRFLFISAFFTLISFLVTEAAEQLSWQACVDETIQGNSELKAAYQSLQSSQFSAKGAYSAYFPRLTGSLDYNESTRNNQNTSLCKQAKRLIRMRDGAVISDERLSAQTHKEEQKVLKAYSRKVGFQIGHVLQHLYQGVKTLAINKIRTGLSMLGILIGVGAVVTMIALGRGAKKAIEEQLASLGTNLLNVRAGAVRGMGGAMVQTGATTRLTAEDAQAIKEKIPSVKQTAPAVTGRAQIVYQNKNWNTSVMGVSSAWASMHADNPKVGRFFSDDENRMRLRIAVVGATLVREVFGGQNPIGEMFKINKVSFQIIGVLPEKGANAFHDHDDRILIPVTTAMRRLYGKDYVDYIDIEVTSADETSVVQEQVLGLMLSRHRIPISQRQDAFHIRNLADIQAALTASTEVMTLLLSVIAAISLLVGGIGIMNIMLVSVTERTREIGLRKAIGARRMDILSQFIIESVVISAVGGILGITLAWIATILISHIAGWATSITLGSIFLSFIFSASIGIIFGLYPARKASLLAPIDALRHE